MNIQVNKAFHRLEIKNHDNDDRSIRILTDPEENRTESRDGGDGHYLNLYTSMVGPLSADFCTDLKKKDDTAFRFEWQFGVSAPMRNDRLFDWVGALREQRSIMIQVLIETPGKDHECIVTQADVNGFKPLNTMKDESTNYLSLAGSIVGDLSPIPFLSKAMGHLTSEADRQDAAKFENRFKNMFRLFRFLTDQGFQGIEYVLSKDILTQWGTFLKGSFNLSFISNAKKSAAPVPYRIKLLPKLGFKKEDDLCYVPSPEQAESIKAELAVNVA